MIRRLALAASLLASAPGCSLLLDTNDLAGGRSGSDHGRAEMTEARTTSADAGTTALPTGDGSTADAVAPTRQPGAPTGCDASCAPAEKLATPTTVFDVGVPIAALAVQGSDVYCGTVSEVIHIAPNAAADVVTARGTLGQMAANASRVFFPENETIFASPLAAGSTVSSLHAQSDSPITAVALLGDTLFYVGPAPDQPGVTSLFSIPAAGGAVTSVVTGTFEDATALAVVGSTAYVADRTGGAVWTVDLEKRSAALLLPVVPDVAGIAVAPPWIWLTTTTGSSSRLLRTTIDGAGALETIASEGVRYTQIVVTDTTVYWAAGTRVVSLPR